MNQINDLFPGNSFDAYVSGELRKKADDLFQQAEAKDKDGKKGEALELLQKARRLSPQHPRIENYRRQLNNQSPTLNVGVIGAGRLPREYTPGKASTYSELLA